MKTKSYKQNPVQEVAKDGEKAAEKVTFNPYTEVLMRLGFAARGVIYATMGLLALQLALGTRGAAADQQGAIAYIGAQPFGRLLLALIVVGLVGYSLWGLVRAFFDPLHKGKDAEGIVNRIGYVISAFSYGALMPPTVGYIQGGQNAARNGAQGAQTQHLTATILAKSWGPWVVGAIGLIGFGGGLYQTYSAIRGNFDRTIKSYQLSPEQVKWIDRIGRFGTAARGVVFAMVGAFLFLAAYFSNPQQARGIDGALRAVLRTPYGPWLLGIIALGLLAFGFYSFLGAIWFRLRK